MHFTLVQIQSFVEIVRRGFHISKAAEALGTSQPVVSKHLKSFEEAMRTPVFARTGKRLTGLTDEGGAILQFAERILQDCRSIEKVGEDLAQEQHQSLSLATTPTLARHLLTESVQAFTKANPDVHLHVRVEESDKAIEAVRLGECDFAIVPVGNVSTSGLSVTPLVEWTRVLIGTPDFLVFDSEEITLERIAAQPIIAFETPTVSLKEIFSAVGLHPDFALSTSNPDVMKAYAAQGLGVAVIAETTFDEIRDAPLISRDVSHLFPNVTICEVSIEESYQSRLQHRFLAMLRTSLSEC